MNFDQAVRTLAGKPLVTERDNPASNVAESEPAAAERTAPARLMRVNHAGEVATQAPYQGQALTARLENHLQAVCYGEDPPPAQSAASLA